MRRLAALCLAAAGFAAQVPASQTMGEPAAVARRGCKCTGNRALDPVCCFEGRAVVPNHLEGEPLRGWRSWQAFAGDVNQTIMEDVMRGLAKKRRPAGIRSLADAGYVDVGLDWGYGNHSGYLGSCHTKDGHMLINHDLFPSFREMTGVAHRLNLTASWYLNADGCTVNESLVGPTYDTDSADVIKYGFDGVKFDSQRGGPSHNITLWASALKKAAAAHGKTDGVIIENCLDKNPQYLIDDPEDCPFNHYRTGPDNAPDFYGGLWRIWQWTLPFLRVTKPVPASRPRCWAYPDQLGIGAPAAGSQARAVAESRGCASMSPEEERTLFANWAIISSPLVLGLDVRNDTEVERYWPIVTNERALRINSAWAGSAGELLKASPSSTRQRVNVGALCEVRSNITALLPDWLIYAKALPQREVAVLAINVRETSPLSGADGASVTLEELLVILTNAGGPAFERSPDRPSPAAFSAVDVWSNETLSVVDASHPWSARGINPHASSFVLFTPI